MKNLRACFACCVILLVAFGVLPRAAGAQTKPEEITVKWDKVERVSKTIPTLQVVVMPPLRRGSPIHARAFQALRDLKASHVRYVPWVPYPKLSIAALEPPRDGKTSWDFSLIDPMTEDFMRAMEGRPVMMDFSTIPAWMFVTDKPVPYEQDPDKLVRGYGTQGTELRDASLKELGDYYARLLQWYTKGGFTDEYGKRHVSNHRYDFAMWEVFNEPEIEHRMTPEQYTQRYDAVVTAMRRVQPRMKFVGMSLAYPGKSPEFFEHFLNPKNHRPGVPVDMISYHFYAKSLPDQTPETYALTFFEQADRFLDVARYIDATRRRLSPHTGTAINEVGSILPGVRDIPASYWNLSGALYAYLYAELARQGIDIVAQSQLLGFPGQFPSVTMLDWKTGEPNARYRVLKLLLDNFAQGDKLVTTELSRNSFVHAQGFVTQSGERKLLLVNKRDRQIEVTAPGIKGGTITFVDQATGLGAASTAPVHSERVALGGFTVAVITYVK